MYWSMSAGNVQQRHYAIAACCNSYWSHATRALHNCYSDQAAYVLISDLISATSSTPVTPCLISVLSVSAILTMKTLVPLVYCNSLLTSDAVTFISVQFWDIHERFLRLMTSKRAWSNLALEISCVLLTEYENANTGGWKPPKQQLGFRQWASPIATGRAYSKSLKTPKWKMGKLKKQEQGMWYPRNLADIN